MKKILLPTEFSAHAGQLLLYALELAKHHHASLTLMHAYHVPINPEESFNEIAAKEMEALMHFAQKNTPKEYQKVDIEYIAEMGFPADAIVRVAEEEDMDAIVMGMKGKTNALEAFFGSVTLEVVNRTDLPVLLIPSTNRFKKIEKIAFALDLRLTDLLAMEHIQQLLGPLNIPINCIHFSEEEESFQRGEKVIAFLAKLFKRHPDFKLFSFQAGFGKFEEEIHDFVVEQNYDLLITQTHQRNWKFRFVDPGSSNRIARKINIPMLILKE